MAMIDVSWITLPQGVFLKIKLTLERKKKRARTRIDSKTVDADQTAAWSNRCSLPGTAYTPIDVFHRTGLGFVWLDVPFDYPLLLLLFPALQACFGARLSLLRQNLW